MGLQIALLGGFEARLDAGPPIRFATRKVEALLAVLAVKPGVAHPRERLATLLWPDSGEPQARGNLRQALALARKPIMCAEGPGIRVSGNSLYLDPTGAEVDVAAFDAAVAVGTPEALRRAAALYRGDFLDGFSLAGEPFEDWKAHEQVRLRDHAIDALGRLLDHCVVCGDADTGLMLGEQLLTLDPLSETACRALMRLHAMQGARGAAVRQYERCRHVLRTELDIEPAAETEALYRQILEPQALSRPRTVPKASIAVLPFANLSPGPEQDYFALGIVEDVITELSRFRSLHVTARNSSFAVAERRLTVPQIGEALGVQYVLEGSIRKSGDAVRITAQLIDAANGFHVWADRYDAALQDIFALQDRITRSVVGALAIRIDERILDDAKRRAREDLQIYDCWLRGLECLRRGSVASDAEARAFFLRAIEIDPHYARAHSGVSLTYFNEWSCNAWDRWAEMERQAFDHARKAVALDDADHVTQCILGRIHLYRREFEHAEKHLERALALNANDADILACIALSKAHLGDPQGGVALAEAAMRLNPYHPDWYIGFVNTPYVMAGRHREAIALLEKAPDALTDTRAFLAVAHAYAGHLDEARYHAGAFLDRFRRNITFGRKPAPREPVEWMLHVNPFRRPADADYLAEGLRRAGLTV